MNLKNLLGRFGGSREVAGSPPSVRSKSFSWIENGTRWQGLGYGSISGLLGIDEGSIDNNTIIWAHNNWLRRSLSEPGIPKVYLDGPDGKPVEQVGHPFTEFLRRPQRGLANSPGHSGKQILAAVARDRQNTGNGYIHKIRKGSKTGPVGWLEYIPYGLCNPVAFLGQPNSLNYYQVMSNGRYIEVPPEDIVHIREGIDPFNPLLGISGLKSAMRLVMSDNEIAAYWQAIVKMPVPSWLISAGGDEATGLDDDFADDLEERFSQKSSGSKRGGIVATSGNIKATKLSLSPEELALEKMLHLPEQRISAVFGVAAMVVGLSAGNIRAKYANWKEAREQATEEVLVPCWYAIGDDVTDQLLPDFDSRPGLYVAYDLSRVKALQEDRAAASAREEGLFMANLTTRADGRAALGLVVDEARDNVFYADVAGAAAPLQEQALKALRARLRESQKRNRQVYEQLQAELAGDAV